MIVQEERKSFSCFDDTYSVLQAVHVPTRDLTVEEAEKFIEGLERPLDFEVVMFGRES